jgi:hypothetical protein
MGVPPRFASLARGRVLRGFGASHQPLRGCPYTRSRGAQSHHGATRRASVALLGTQKKTPAIYIDSGRFLILIS